MGLVCNYCGKEFTRYLSPSNIARGDGKYCSLACYRKGRRRRVKLKCEICGKEFYTTPSQVSSRGRKHCSKQCFALALSGDRCHMWRGGKSFEPYCSKFTRELKEDIREHFGRKCYLCQTPENGEKLSIHHVDYNKSQGCEGLRWSLIPLCRHCHSLTTNRRFFYFHLLRDYWIYDHLDFITKTGGFEAC
jgi:hypothetical protein